MEIYNEKTGLDFKPSAITYFFILLIKALVVLKGQLILDLIWVKFVTVLVVT
jgi:hypothetical protein